MKSFNFAMMVRYRLSSLRLRPYGDIRIDLRKKFDWYQRLSM